MDILQKAHRSLRDLLHERAVDLSLTISVNPLSADEAIATLQTKAGRGPERDIQLAAIREFEARLKKELA